MNSHMFALRNQKHTFCLFVLGITFKNGDIRSNLVSINPNLTVKFKSISTSLVFTQNQRLLIGHVFNVYRSDNKFFAITMFGEQLDKYANKEGKSKNSKLFVQPLTVM